MFLTLNAVILILFHKYSETQILFDMAFIMYGFLIL